MQYKNVGRLIDMSGMYVLVERGNVVRYFMKDDAVQGNSAELAGFLTESAIFRWNRSQYDRRCGMEPIYAVNLHMMKICFITRLWLPSRG